MTALLALLLTGCVITVHSETETLTFEEPVTAVRVTSDAGDVSFVGDTTTDVVTVDVTTEYSRQRPAFSAQVVDGVLVVDVVCERTLGVCSVALDVALPPAVDLDVETGAGELRARSIDGRAQLRTDAGDIEVTDHQGDVDLRTDAGAILAAGVHGELHLETDAGDITGWDLTGSSVAALTDAGAVELQATGDLQLLIADSGAGDLDLRVPAGAYDVDVDTGAGSVDISGITQDGSAGARIDASTGAGDIRIRGE